MTLIFGACACTKKVLDIVLDQRYFDFGFVYDNWQGFAFMLQTMMGQGNNNFQSYYTRQHPMARYQIKSVVKAFDKT